MAFWAPIIAAGISAAGSMGSGLLSSSGAAAANAASAAQTDRYNQQMLAAEMAKHEQNTAFMEDSQAHDLFKMHEQNVFNATEAEKARLFQSKQADKFFNLSSEFDQHMSNTAYQRAMADMRKAGLNPILAYQQGGASAPHMAPPMPSGASASAGSGSGAGMATGSGAPPLRTSQFLNDKEGLSRGIANMVSSAVDTMKTYEGVELMKQQNKESQQREVVGAAEARLKHWDAEKRERETTGAEIDNEIKRANAKTAQELSRVAAGEAGNMERYGRKEAPDTLERMFRTIQSWFEQNGTSMPAPPAWDNSKKLF